MCVEERVSSGNCGVFVAESHNSGEMLFEISLKTAHVDIWRRAILAVLGDDSMTKKRKQPDNFELECT
jgi:hypothetical protein